MIDFFLTNYAQLFGEGPLSKERILENKKLIQKARDELRMSTDTGKDAVELLKECVAELEQRGFIELIDGQGADERLYEIRD